MNCLRMRVRAKFRQKFSFGAREKIVSIKFLSLSTISSHESSRKISPEIFVWRERKNCVRKWQTFLKIKKLPKGQQFFLWSGWRESDPRSQLGKLEFCHWTTSAWSLWAGSNRRPVDYESTALPTEPHKQKYAIILAYFYILSI